MQGMILFVNLHGGANYAHSDRADEYPSLEAAAREYHRRSYDRYYPLWGDPSVYDSNNEGRFYAGFAWYVPADDPDVIVAEDGTRTFSTIDNYPDRELTVGPRGGLRWERC